MKPDSGAMFDDADSYEAYMGRWSRLVAQQVVPWLHIAPGRAWLDVGAGTGMLSQAILQQASPAKVVGIDSSPEYVEFAREHSHDDRVEFRVSDAVNLPFELPEFDVAISGLVLNFLPAPHQAVKGMVQAVRREGLVAAYVWDYLGRMEMIRHFWDAAVKVDPSAREMEGRQRYTLGDPDHLRSLFQSVDLGAIEVTPIDIQTRFRDFDDYWLPFRSAQGSVSRYLHSLSDEKRSAVRDQLRSQLPTTDDGAIPLVARAWAVKGKR